MLLNETEIKLKIESKTVANQLLNRFKEMTSFIYEEQLQRDEYYDAERGELAKNDLVLRIRKLNEKVYIAMKSPRIFLTDSIQKRIELEFESLDIEQVRKDILRQGLCPKCIIEKKRCNFKLYNCTISIDEVPFIGYFLEVESADIDSINNAINLLGLTSYETVNNNYGELLEKKFKEIGLPTVPNLNATFEEYNKFYLK